MNNYFIILAAGSSKRFSFNKPKQYYLYKNKAIFEHSLEKAVNSKLFKKIILVVDNLKKILFWLSSIKSSTRSSCQNYKVVVHL